MPSPATGLLFALVVAIMMADYEYRRKPIM